MDLLQRELERKKSVLAKVQAAEGRTDKKRKYWKQSELRRLEEDEEEQAKAEAAKKAAAEEEEEERETKEREHQATTKNKRLKAEDHETTDHKQKRGSKTNKATTSKTRSNHESASTSSSVGSEVDATDNDGTATAAAGASTNASSISPQQVTRQLRAFGLPIRFFGERLEQRIERLQVALQTQHQTLQGLSEMEEYRLGQGHGIRNQFLERSSRHEDLMGSNTSFKEKKVESREEKGHDPTKDDEQNPQGKHNHHESDEEADSDPAKKVYKFLKGLLKEWEAELEARPNSVANSVAGRNESKTLKQCKDYIRPLFKQLKRRKLEAGMQAHLTKIVECAQQGEFVKAHDAYMDVAIGRAAWPIGVTMVGIHARSGRAKIESANVAHVMNSELQRKYLTSVKRLLSYAQKKRPDVDPSKKVL